MYFLTIGNVSWEGLTLQWSYTKVISPSRSRLAFLDRVFPHLVSCFQIIPEISTSVIFIQNETLKFRLLFINFASFSDYIVAIKEVN